MSDWRTEPCPSCEGHGGRFVLTRIDYNGNECGYNETCFECDGTGKIEIDAEMYAEDWLAWENDINEAFEAAPLEEEFA